MTRNTDFILRQTFRFALVVLAILIGTIPALSETARLNFIGVVPSHSKSVQVRDYPRTLVSFTSQIALPVQVLANRSSDIRVFNHLGSGIPNTRITTLPAAKGQQVVALVKLPRSGTYTFVACAANRKHCIRYQVARY